MTSTGEVSNLRATREKFFEESQILAVSQQDIEPVIAAFHQSLPQAITENPVLGDAIDSYLNQERINNPSYQNNKVYRAWQATIISDDPLREEVGFPERFDDPLAHLAAWNHLLSAPKGRYLNRFRRFMDNPLQINRGPERASPVAFIGALLTAQHSLGVREAVTVYEPGTAAGRVMRSLAMGKRTEVAVINADGKNDVMASSLFNALTGLFRLKEGIGVDLKPAYTERDRERIKGFTLNPSQLDRRSARGTNEDTYDLLEAVMPEQPISIMKGNFLTLSDEKKTFIRARRPRITFLSHTLSQNPQDLEKILDTTLPLMNSNGWFLVHEYHTIDSQDPQKLTVADRWYNEPWQCLTSGLSVRHREEGFMPLLLWENSLCRRVRLMPGLGKIAAENSGLV